MNFDSSPGPTTSRTPALKRTASSLSLSSPPADRAKRARHTYEEEEYEEDEQEHDSMDEMDDSALSGTRSSSADPIDAGAEATSSLPEPIHAAGDAPSASLADELAEELTCGCCSALCYNPVSVAPCSHYFCGSCFTLWVSNGGTSCPACRTPSTSVTPARALQRIIDIVVRHDPSRARTLRERLQADEVYTVGRSIRLPSPRQQTPEPTTSNSGAYFRPCLTCVPNQIGWRCPVPIPDPVTDPARALPSDGDLPVGHAYCANCDMLHGIRVAERCSAQPLRSQYPQGFSDISDLLEASEVYDVFNGNGQEVEFLFDHLLRERMNMRAIYFEIIAILQASPDGFANLIASDLGQSSEAGSSSSPARTVDANTAPRRRACRECAGQVFIEGLMQWWIAERAKGRLAAHVASRPKCESGSGCTNQSDIQHTKDFNHIDDLPKPAPAPAQQLAGSESSAPSTSTASQSDGLLAFNPVAESSPLIHRGGRVPTESDFGLDQAVREGGAAGFAEVEVQT